MLLRLTLLVASVSFGLLVGCQQNNSPSTSPYPGKTVTIICPWAAGGGTDRISRFWAESLKDAFGSNVIVMNRTGGSGATGHMAGARAKPNGLTITTITAELSTMHRMGVANLTYDDFQCILQMNADPAAIIVRNNAPWKSLRQFLDDIKKRPGKIKMSGTAVGGTWDLARAGLLLADGLAVNSVIWIPTEGAAPSLVELLGGHLDAVCCSVPEAAAQIEGGQLRVLTVMSKKRMPGYPDFSTCLEEKVDWVAVGWRGLAVPKGTPQPIVDQLSQTCQAIAESDQFLDFMNRNGFGVEIKMTTDFLVFLKKQDEQWKSVVEAAGYAQP